MATLAVASDREIARALNDSLAHMPLVSSVHLLPTETALSVWVGISEDDPAVRKDVYLTEDHIADRFPQVLFDFHVVPIPRGKTMGDFISAANPIFQRGK